MAEIIGKIVRINGPVVQIRCDKSIKMLDMVEIGEEKLVGEVVRLKENIAHAQVYEDTTSLKAGDPVYSDHMPLSLELGPGLIGNIFDGIQRPLEMIKKQEGDFISRGLHVQALDRDKKWHFVPLKKTGDRVNAGSIIGEVQESSLIKHKIMVPPNLSSGILNSIADEGDYTVDDIIAELDIDGQIQPLRMFHKWAVRKPRPYKQKIPADKPLITGQRVIDTLFPVAKGGCVAVPGGFGTGKTVVQHQLAKWSDADVVVFVGCGERGNEMTDVLANFTKLIDPRTGKLLLERTVFVANTSNMPVAAREASIYTGITIAEYFRDMGYDVALMADSTSRWAEALRELSGRMEEIPLEEGFPAYLPVRLAEFYERAGKVVTPGEQNGSITVIASVSPPGGDFSEPVTSHTKRFIRCFWALDRDLAYSRHYPAISWIDSYSEYVDDVKLWWDVHIDGKWPEYRYAILDLLQKEQRLQQIVKLIGADVLPNTQKLILETCSLFKNAFLQQSAFDEVDTYCSPKKQFLMFKAIIMFHRKSEELIKEGFEIVEIRENPVYHNLVRMKTRYKEDNLEQLEKFVNSIEEQLQQLKK
ncbi:MAG TPA: V-type ATP synthase subunit A [bacterium]|nr:V-type ATP synthase subunit A [bacterium]HOL35635.1 V-type ATP synthase subunit A [bacterium]HPP08918.1 V-type ATP synthase subunit A [bacterium]